ncbi:DUF4197 domain-containing protein [Novosphingobium sp. BW1]|nr:DUF4197 domain-containing protein [Novosphingobium sp. BW1]
MDWDAKAPMWNRRELLQRGAGSPLDMTGGLVRAVNEAAGVAAGAAKPVLRTAIRDLHVADMPGIASRSDGATRYLRTSAGEKRHGALRPLVDNGLEEVGAYRWGPIPPARRPDDFVAAGEARGAHLRRAGWLGHRTGARWIAARRAGAIEALFSRGHRPLAPKLSSAPVSGTEA